MKLFEYVNHGSTKMSKYRVIWIDDERNPNTSPSYNVLYPRWRCVVPGGFLLEMYKDKTTNGYPKIVWLKSYDEWLDWCVDVWHNEDDDEWINCFCLDHDLASYRDGKEKTGRDVAYDIIDELTISSRKMPYYECHSANPAGKQNIESIFESYKKYFYDQR